MRRSPFTAWIEQIDPMTVITPLIRGVAWLQWALLRYLATGEYKELRDLQFIHFARWTIIGPKNFKVRDEEQPAEKFRNKFLFFYTNFNGPWDQYIEAFALQPVIRRGMKILWGGSAGFPGPVPVTPFKRYIHYFQREVDNVYFAYGDSTVRTIGHALEVDAEVRRFVAATPEGESSDAFNQRYWQLQEKLVPLLGGRI